MLNAQHGKIYSFTSHGSIPKNTAKEFGAREIPIKSKPTQYMSETLNGLLQDK
jgi:hypothetical protein